MQRRSQSPAPVGGWAMTLELKAISRRRGVTTAG